MADYAIHDTTLIGISDVIRKKEGSSALIDPAEYEDRINLMGMLEEKTASSASVCSFSDGADDVPMTSVVAHIAPTLTGTNAVNMVQNGKNLLNTSAFDSLEYYTVNANGSITVNSSDSRSWSNVSALIFLKAGTYTLSRSLTGSQCYIRSSLDNYASNACSLGNSATKNSFTLTGDAYIKIKVGYNGTYPFTDTYQLEVGSTESTFEKYTAPTSYTANLGRTVYGADADLVSGQGSETGTKIKLNSLSWIYNDTEYSYGYFDARYNLADMTDAMNFQATGYINNQNARSALADGEIGVYNKGNAIKRVVIRDDSCTTLEQFLTKIADYDFVYESTTGTSFTFDGQEIPSLLGVNNLWHDAGNTEAVYRSSGTVTPLPPVPPVLISKSITQNGTYDAEDDDADGYDTVTVNVQGSAFTPAWSETKIVDNSSLASSITFTEDYHNYGMIKIVVYNSSSQIYDTIFADPTGIDKAFTYSSNHFCVNQQVAGSSNQYACYNQDSTLTWSRVANRNVNIYEVYGITFTNCVLTKEVIYSRDAIASGTVTPTAPTGKTFFDYDAIMYMVCTTDANVTCFSKYLISKAKMSFSQNDFAVALMAYNSSRTVIYTETSIGTHNYFYVVGLKFTATPSLLSMSPSPTPSESDSEDPEDVEEEET